jgi:hypothetical protein
MTGTNRIRESARPVLPPAGVNGLLARVEGVRKNGAGKWVARCPAHADKRPSLAIRDLADGRILIHCFAGCDTESVLGAAGLEWADVMPPKAVSDRQSPARPPFDAWTALRCCTDDLFLAAIVISDVCRGVALSPERREQLWPIAGRLRSAAELVGAAR